jgi:drug/metabolite transporter (DMT)-like permease
VGNAIASRQSGLRLISYAAIFVLWGGSFLAVREIVTVAPPFLAASFRFLVAGLLLLAYGRATDAPVPVAPEIRSTALLGVLMLGVN